MSTKLVCWTGFNGLKYEFEAPEHLNWMAFDWDGSLRFYSEKPHLSRLLFRWTAGRGYERYHCWPKSVPPERGHWSDQLYWIGDES